jgi:glycosyltransferase involved in cell wall biosynthesis
MVVALIVESSFPPVNRANLRLYRLARILVKKSHDIYFISPSKFPWLKKSLDYEGIKVRQYFGFDHYLYSKIRLLVRSYHLIACVLSVIYLNLKNRFDALQAWNPLAGLAAILAGKIIRKPVFIDFTDFYSDIAQTDSNRLAVPILKYIELLVLKNARKVIVVSEIMKKRLMNLGISENKIEIVEDGVDKNMFTPDVGSAAIREKLGLADNPIIVYHGDIKYPDGVDLLFRAFSRVLKEIGDAKLLIMGGGGNYFEELKKLARQLVIQNSIVYTGWIDHQEVPKYLAAANIGAMPMRATLNHNCYLSFKLFEYWASGKPIVTTRLDAICQIVKNGENGLVINPENIEELAQALTYLLKNPDQAQKMGLCGRKLVEEKFDWDLLMEKETKLYEDIGN